MSVLDRVTLKSVFENGDQPQGSDYANLIDSMVNLAETTTQTMNGPLVLAGGLSAASISTGNITATGIVSAATFWGAVANVTTISAQTVTFSTLSVPSSGASVTGNITFTAGDVLRTVDASVACISTAQASARLLTASLNVIKSSTTAANDSVRLPGLYPGCMTMVVNDTTQSAKVFPPTGGQINALGANAALDLGPNTGAIRQAIFYCSTSTQAYAIRGS
jgi:hypothetical protein